MYTWQPLHKDTTHNCSVDSLDLTTGQFRVHVLSGSYMDYFGNSLLVQRTKALTGTSIFHSPYALQCFGMTNAHIGMPVDTVCSTYSARTFGTQ